MLVNGKNIANAYQLWVEYWLPVSIGYCFAKGADIYRPSFIGLF